MTAVGWGETRTRTFISNVINTLPGLLANRPRHEMVIRDVEVDSEQELINLPRPICVKFMINYISFIGGHNYLRQR